MINAPFTSSLYGFVPICEIFSFTCSDVEGIAIQLRPKRSNSTGGRQTNISKLRQEIEEEISSDMKFEIKSL
jgi:hypothetical protein